DIYTATLKTESVAEKNILQKTQSHSLIKKDRRSGTVVFMEIQVEPSLEEVYYIGANIQYTEYPRVIEPKGRKRTYKRRWYDEEPYPYDDEY
ncbi:unnamed protein product, partial [marine sediment metagenome]